MNTILSITGSDSTGGAGIQADIKTISRLGGCALSVVTTLTMQNTIGIQDFYDIPAEIIERQFDAVAEDVHPYVVKIGLVRNVFMLQAIIRCLKRHKPQWVLYSPVITSSHGDMLMTSEMIETMQSDLIPLCNAVVVRERDASHFHSTEIITADDTHGRCNELCSTIAVLLSQGMNLEEATQRARYTMPAEASSELSGRSLNLYREFLSLQERDCSNAHDVNYYATQLGVSSRYLSQVTRKVVDQSPKSIIDATLLTRIKQLLQSNKTIQEIAYELEFSSQAHLSNYFKRFTGSSPSEYRKVAYL